ncbi:hypothetical protein IRJ41_001409 [Triplophysa rosa]|uniref:Uncharacterized protein n=1 Tax=Triplophysa rosa TaxID=992332 RepID=A0A9W7WPW3_TRIRA|nr:hypothetical protein IRJ41_001409 [Triplophysa rosa]
MRRDDGSEYNAEVLWEADGLSGEIPSANRGRARKEAGREGGDLANGDRGGGGDNWSAMMNIRKGEL